MIPDFFRTRLKTNRCREDDNIIIASRQGYATRFLANVEGLRPSGRPSRGVKVKRTSIFAGRRLLACIRPAFCLFLLYALFIFMYIAYCWCGAYCCMLLLLLH